MRGPGASAPGYWTPPSGGIEDGESPADTVVREMREELDVTVRPVRSVWQCPTEDGNYDLDWWLVEITEGEPRCAESQIAAMGWFSLEELESLSPTFDDDMRFVREIWPEV